MRECLEERGNGDSKERASCFPIYKSPCVHIWLHSNSHFLDSPILIMSPLHSKVIKGEGYIHKNTNLVLFDTKV